MEKTNFAVESFAPFFEQDEILAKPQQELAVKEHEKLVAAFQQQLAEANSTIETLLSASQEFQTKQGFDELKLSSLHPFEQYKAMYLDTSKPVLTYEQLPYPTCFCPSTIMAEITAISEHYSNQLIEQMDFVTENNTEAGATMFTTRCGDKFVINKEKMSQHLEFMEILKNLDDKLIENDPLTTAYTLLNHFIRVYRP